MILQRKVKAMNKTLLVVIAHPDDESFPMGGTLAKYATEGVRVVLVSATRGEAGIPGLNSVDTAHLREAELSSAAQVLGVSRLEFLDYLDGEFDQADEEAVVGKLLKIIQREKPDALITFGPDGISGHPDHVAAHRFTTAAFDRSGINGRLFYMLPSEATQQGCGIPPSKELAGGPVVSIDISDYRVSKVRAMQCHASQEPPFSGDSEEEAEKLTCHEYFVLARPRRKEQNSTDLFE
jgi:LmbE family N-acetylglucosaminyl deacetylase